MTASARLALLFVLSLCTAGVAAADVWDEGGDPDNDLATNSDNELVNGSDQVHDLGALPGPVADQDYFSVTVGAFGSWEAIVDGTTGDLNNGGAPDFLFERLSPGGVQSAQIEPFGFSRTIRWQGSGSVAIGSFLHVGDAACGTACTAADQYHVRLYDTSYAVPRFNNSATQVTVVILQNTSDDVVNAVAYFFDPAGTLLWSEPRTLGPHALAVVPTAAIPALAGTSGSIIVTNDGHYGVLAGKAVAVEPATGFTFDTAMTARGH